MTLLGNLILKLLGIELINITYKSFLVLIASIILAYWGIIPFIKGEDALKGKN